MQTPVILITGGSRGIGRELVKILSKLNYSIVTSSRFENHVKILNQLKNVDAFMLDISDEESISKFVKWFWNKGYSISTLVNNAGTAIMGSLEFIPQEERMSLIQTNLFGTISLTLKLKDRLDKGKSKIINISSDEGLITLPQSVDYAISKHGLEAFSEGLRYELKNEGIQVITVNPGTVKTDLSQHIINELEKRLILTKDDLKFQKFQNERIKLIEEITEHKSQQDPKIIADQIVKIIESSNPLPQYLMTSPSETDFLISTLIDQIVLLNSTSEFGFTQDELISKLRFSTDALENLIK